MFAIHWYPPGDTNVSIIGMSDLIFTTTVKPVGKRRPNPFGIYDMAGNVAEWCFDRYEYNYYSSGDDIDPMGWQGQYKYRVVRGGDILNAPEELESFRRWQFAPFEKSGLNGIRLVLPAE